MNEEKRNPTREQVLDAIHHAHDKPTVRTAQRMVRQWLDVNPDDTEIVQASSSLTVAATALLSGTVPPYHSTTAAPETGDSASPHIAADMTADMTQATVSDATQATLGADEIALRLIKQLESENAFLRAQVEEANRNAAELRAALREAQRIYARALSSPDDNAA